MELSLEGSFCKSSAGDILTQIEAKRLDYFEHFLVRTAQYADRDVNQILTAYHKQQIIQFSFIEKVNKMSYAIHIVMQDLVNKHRITLSIKKINTESQHVIDFGLSSVSIQCQDGFATHTSLTEFIDLFFDDDFKPIMTGALSQYINSLSNKKDSG